MKPVLSALVHDESIDAQRPPPAGQGAKVDGRAVDVQAQDSAVDLIGQPAPLGLKRKRETFRTP